MYYGSHSFRANGLKCMVHYFDSLDGNDTCIPPIGSIITVKHSGCYSNGLLKRPVFWRVAFKQQVHPAIWCLILNQEQSLNKDDSLWTQPEEHILFFERLASQLSIDTPSKWYQLNKSTLYQYGGQKLLEKHYNGSLYQVYLSFFF